MRGALHVARRSRAVRHADGVAANSSRQVPVSAAYKWAGGWSDRGLGETEECHASVSHSIRRGHCLPSARLMVSPDPVTATKSKMGCDTDTEMWDAALGKCAAGYAQVQAQVGRSGRQPTAKAAAKKAPAAQEGAGGQEGSGCRQVACRLGKRRSSQPARAARAQHQDFVLRHFEKGNFRARKLQDEAAQHTADAAVRGHDGVAAGSLRAIGATRSDSMR